MVSPKCPKESFDVCFSSSLSLLDPEADKEATEMLTDNAQNLMKVVSEVLYATEAATIRVPPDARATLTGLNWVKREKPKSALA